MAGWSTDGPIGVDIEYHRNRDFAKLIESWFNPDEYQEFLSLKKSQKEDWFYRCWTRKEANCKATGEDLSLAALASKADAIENNVHTVHLPDYTASIVHHSPINPTIFQGHFGNLGI